MTIRILNVPGASEAARKARLATLEAWMGRHGWHLMDYSAEAGSAMFERPPEAPRLMPWHPTRWLPGPAAYHPRNWLSYLAAEPRLAVVLGALVLVASVGTMAVVSPPAFLADRAALQEAARAREEAKGTWRFVNVSALNLRSAPSGDAHIVGILYKNQKVRVEQVTNGWAKLTQPEPGYVAEKFLQEQPLR